VKTAAPVAALSASVAAARTLKQQKNYQFE
jgi:hypothetical protein